MPSFALPATRLNLGTSQCFLLGCLPFPKMILKSPLHIQKAWCPLNIALSCQSLKGKILKKKNQAVSICLNLSIQYLFSFFLVEVLLALQTSITIKGWGAEGRNKTTFAIYVENRNIMALNMLTKKALRFCVTQPLKIEMLS